MQINLTAIAEVTLKFAIDCVITMKWWNVNVFIKPAQTGATRKNGFIQRRLNIVKNANPNLNNYKQIMTDPNR